MKQELLVWKMFPDMDVFGIKNYVSTEGMKVITPEMLFNGLSGNYLVY